MSKVRVTKAYVWRAIYKNCKDCIYDKADVGTARQQVKSCTITTCALWPIRLGKDGEFFLETAKVDPVLENEDD